MTERRHRGGLDLGASGWLAQAWRAAGERDAALDPTVRRERGVVHTPPEVARFVVRRLEATLKDAGLASTLSDARLTFVDPAIGTGVFAAALVDHAGPVRIVGFDLDVAALERAHALLGSACRLTVHAISPLGSRVPDPALAADAPGPLVVLGNPPWAGRSASRGVTLSDALLRDFDRDASGKALGEKKRGVLSDDYVRFVRWALEVVSLRRDGGAMGLVVNASWIDGPVHRGMRRMLIEGLPRLDVVDLGGSALTGRAPGQRDENLFDVRPGASVIVGATGKGAAVRFAALRGSRSDKHAALEAIELRPTAPVAPHHALRPMAAVPARYREAPSVADWLPFHREGLQTNRDALVIDADADALMARAAAIVRGELTLPARRHFDPQRARVALARELDEGLAPRRVAYRPFDDRFYLPSAALCHRPRPELARAVEASALVLVTTRQDRGTLPFAHLVLTRHVPDNCLLSLRSSCRARGFPSHGPDGRSNVAEPVAIELRQRLGRSPEAEEVLLWIAAHLGAPRYTEPLDGALKIDFPRVPLPIDRDRWAAGVEAGRALLAAFEAGPAEPGDTTRVGHHRVGGEPARRLALARSRADALHGDLL